MNENTINLIERVMSEPFLDILPDIQEIVTNYDLYGLNEELDQLTEVYENYDPLDLSDAIRQIVIKYMRYLISEHEIKVTDEAPLEELVDIASSIDKIQYYIDHGVVEAIVSMDEPPEEKFATIRQLFNGRSIERNILSLESVPESLINQIERLHRDQANEDEETLELPESYVSQMRDYKTYCEEKLEVPIESIWGFGLIRQGINLGGLFSFYHGILSKRLSEKVDQLAAYQVLMLLFMGIDTHDKVLSEWATRNDQIYDTLDTITQVDIKLRNLYVDFDKWRSAKNMKVKAL